MFSTESELFSYRERRTPRVFASHRPLIASPGTTVRIRVEPELEPGQAVSSARAQLLGAAGGIVDEGECDALGASAFECSFPVPDGEPTLSYRAEVTAGGETFETNSAYRFQVAPPADDTLVPLRVPAEPEVFRIDLAWVRDASDGAFDAAAALGELERLIYDGILRDPAYRWRDAQLGFFFYTRPGVTRSYPEGRDTRCGQNPWPADEGFPPALAAMEIVAVVHQRGADPTAIEGAAGAGGFRDCAGEAVESPGVATFSTRAGAPLSPRIAKHEYGHAAFALGEEYTEPQASRSVSPSLVLPGEGCCCAVPEDEECPPVGGGDTGGSETCLPLPPFGQRVRCVQPGGGVVISIALGGSPAECPQPFPPAGSFCGEEPQGGCPGLGSGCVGASAWLGDPLETPVPDRRNNFESESACLEARAGALTSPSVEDPESSLGACQLLCGGTPSACPCAGSARAEVWIVDTDPAPRGGDDAMDSGLLLGGTCQRCVDTSLCVRWQRALGDTKEEAWDYCDEPPEWAAHADSVVEAIVRYVIALIQSLLRQVVNLGGKT